MTVDQDTHRDEQTSSERPPTPSRDARLQRAGARFDTLDPEVRAELARSRAGLELAERERERRDHLILKLRAQKVNVADIAYGLGMSYDGVVKVIQHARRAPKE